MARQLLNTLFVMNPKAYVKLDYDTLKVEADGQKLIQVPLQHLGAITLFGGASISSGAMERCAEDGREITFLDFAGRFRFRVAGPVSGNVLLRKAQYDAHCDSARTLELARTFVAGKLRNSRSLLLRSARDLSDADRKRRVSHTVEGLTRLLESLPETKTLDEARGIEGQGSALYFEVFGELIRTPSDEFSFRTRTRRPPRDRVNALLSFLYALLTSDCAGALEGVGLDPQFGFLHALRPGRPALALDLMEEFRSAVVDRLVLALVNRRQLRPEHFEEREEGGGSVLLTEEGRKAVLVAYQKRKEDPVPHAALKEKTPLGLVWHLQARLLARHLRGDLESYPPFVVS